MPAGGVYGAPRLPRTLVRRRRLWEQLASMPAEHVVLVAPVGSGATTGLADWAAHAPHPPGTTWIWVDLSRRAAEDPDALWHGALDLLRDAGAGSGASPEQTEVLLRSGVDPRVALARRLLQSSTPLRLVVDDAPACTALLDDLQALARSVPDLQIVTVLHAVPESWLRGTWRRPDDLGVLDAGALAFDVAETRELLRAWGAPAPAAYAGRVHQLTGGHPRSSQALVHTLVRAEVPLEPAELAPELLAALVGLDRLDHYPDVAIDEDAKVSLRDRLSRIAMASSPTPSLARQLAGDAAVPAAAAAEELGLGAWSMTGPQPRLQLTRPAATLLRQELRAADPDGARDLLRRITAWSLENGHLTEAVVGALGLDDLVLAAAIVRDHRGRLLLARPAALDAIAGSLRPAMARAEPGVADLATLLYSLSGRHRRRALQCLDSALELADTTAGTSLDGYDAIRLGLSLCRDLARGQVATAALAADHLDPLLDRRAGSGPEVPESARVEHLRRIGLVRRAVGQDAAALAALERAVAIDSSSAHPRQVRTLSDLAAIHAANGDLATARRVAGATTSGSWPTGWLEDVPALTHHVYEAWAALERHDPATAAAHLETAEALADPTEFWTHVALPLALADFLAAEPTGAARTIEARHRQLTADPATAPMPMPWRETLTEALTLLDLAVGDLHRAAERRTGGPATARTALTAARAALFTDSLDTAVAQLDLARGRGLDRPRDRADHAAIGTALALRASAPAAVEKELAALGLLLDELQLTLPVTLLPVTDQRALRPRLALSTVMRPHPPHAPSRSREPRLLTPREQVVLADLAAGLKLTQIARHNVVSINTVKTQVRSIYRKLGVRSRDEAVAAATTRGLLTEPPAGE